MILHDLSAGMHPRRVRIFMAEKGIAIERREVDAAGGANALPDFLRTLCIGSGLFFDCLHQNIPTRH